MSKIVLSAEGVFPLSNGEETVLGVRTSGTLQGEGILVGVPSLFVRLAGCNLRCLFQGLEGHIDQCDTPHAQLNDIKDAYEVDDVVQLVANHLGALRHVVITGGEPMLQKEAVAELCERLRAAKKGIHITLETNGTFFSKRVSKAVDLVSMSPKCQVGTFEGEKPSRAYVSSMQQWIDSKCRERDGLQLKFVVGCKEDERKLIEPILHSLHDWEKCALVVMPLGGDLATIRKSAPLAVEIAIRRGWRYSPRLQIDLWAGRKGS